MSAWRGELSLQRRTRQLQLALTNDFEPWLALLAARHEQPVEAIVARLDADPLLLATEVATLRYQDAIRHAHYLMDLGKERAKKMAESARSEHDAERLGAAMAEEWIADRKARGLATHEDRKTAALATAAKQFGIAPSEEAGG